VSKDNTSASTANVTELKARYQSLQVRAEKLGESLQSLVPLNERSQAAQESFLLAYADFKALQKAFASAKEGLNGIVILNSTKEEIEAEGGLWEDLAEMAKDLLSAAIEELGVTEEAVRASCLKDFLRVLDHIESLVARAETESTSAAQ